MANKMLIDATHPEETRVVVLHGNRVEEFDFESANRKQLRGNIYLAKVTRVEPSLQAAFVDYGGNRHGFLAFSEIHPDYYQIPVADRQALIEEETRAHRDADDEDDHRRGGRHRHRRRGSERPRAAVRSEPIEPAPGQENGEQPGEFQQDNSGEPSAPAFTENSAEQPGEYRAGEDHAHEAHEDEHPVASDERAQNESEYPEDGQSQGEPSSSEESGHDHPEQAETVSAHEAGIQPGIETNGGTENGNSNGAGADEQQAEEEHVESVGGDAMDEAPVRAPRYRRQYKIQEVIKRRQVMLVQVVKEERGTKGAALTTYLSLAGRYSVLMPNTARGGGISRKITNSEDRQRLKEVAGELQVPEGMGVILRTAGASRTKTEVQRDFEYLLRLWETIRDLTLKSTAPALVYEEGSLVKRSIRDLYHKDIDDIVVEGEAAYKEAKEFMRMLMPSHVKNVKLYRELQPIFARYGIEAQLDAMFQPTVQLKSGGYIVLNQTEALVAIDVNSGRATREHSIEETALKTNSEAAAEIARQLRLRDLAGLVVIDFIDMDENRNNRTVERKLKEALKDDRARIQVGRISHFGLMEMSRQRIRTSVLESSTETCPHCGGTGHVRSVSSVALQLLRAIEEMLMKGATHNLMVRTRSDVALYVLNHKRAYLRMLEERFRILIAINADPSITGQPAFTVDRGEQVMTIEQAKALVAQHDSAHSAEEAAAAREDEEEFVEADVAETEEEPATSAAPPVNGERGDGRKRRRGRRGRGGRGRGEGRDQSGPRPDQPVSGFAPEGEDLGETEIADPVVGSDESMHQPADTREEPVREGEPREGGRGPRRRGRRGGRRNRRGRNGEGFHRDDAAAGAPGDAPPAPREFNHEPDTTPRYEPRPATFTPQSEPVRSEPVRAEAMRPEPAHAEPVRDAEPPRRRSTVREPAPVFGGGAATPPPAPPPSAPAPIAATPEKAPEADKPRRGGWWRRG